MKFNFKQAEVKAKEREAEENAKQLENQLRNTQDILAKTSREAQELRSELNHQIALSSEKQAQLINQEKDKLLKVSIFIFTSLHFTLFLSQDKDTFDVTKLTGYITGKISLN